MMRAMMFCCVVGCGLAVGCSKSKPTAKNPDPVTVLIDDPSQSMEPIGTVDDDQRRLAKNNLHVIMEAVFTYFDSYSTMPNVEIKTKPGKTKLSWRVHVLPYLDQQKLYAEFKLDEPWDSATNKALIGKMPKVCAPVHAKVDPGMTFTRGFAGPGAPFEEGKKLKFLSFPDGSSNTIGLIEAGDAVVWTQPGNEIPFDKTKPLPKLGGDVDGDFHAALFNGLGIVIKRDYDEAAMKGAITINGGEVPEMQKLTPMKK